MIEAQTYTCKKIAYRSRKEAKKERDRINKLKRNDNLKDAYRCPVCNTWHLTSMNKKKSRLITRKNT